MRKPRRAVIFLAVSPSLLIHGTQWHISMVWHRISALSDYIDLEHFPANFSIKGNLSKGMQKIFLASVFWPWPCLSLPR